MTEMSTTTERGAVLARRIRERLSPPTEDLVAAYFDPTRRFAGSTFDTLPPNDPDHFDAADLLATSLLDVHFLPRAVRGVLQDHAEEFNRLLSLIPSDVDLWRATDEQLAPAYDLWTRLRTLDGVGPTRTSKLMARKRPRLIPVVDKVIREHLELDKRRDDSWVLLRAAVAHDDCALVKCIEELRGPAVPSGVSTLRVLDAALWMNLSRSTHVTPLRAAPTVDL